MSLLISLPQQYFCFCVAELFEDEIEKSLWASNCRKTLKTGSSNLVILNKLFLP